MVENSRPPRRIVTWCEPSPCCRTHSPPTSARSSRTGATQKACPRIPWRHSARAVISSASPRNARPGILETFLPMPNSPVKPYLAFDSGAQSGRAVLARLQSGILTTEEIHRFPNDPVEYGGALHWDMPRLWFEVRSALSRLGEVELAGIGVDAWGVDYALLGERGELLQNPYHYRDRRTEGVMEEVLRIGGREEIYQATGIQFMPLNTLYQLFAAQRQTPKMLEAAKCLLTIPDLFNYWLTGNAVCEFASAPAPHVADPLQRAWAAGVMQRLELPVQLAPPIVE